MFAEANGAFVYSKSGKSLEVTKSTWITDDVKYRLEMRCVGRRLKSFQGPYASTVKSIAISTSLLPSYILM